MSDSLWAQSAPRSPSEATSPLPASLRTRGARAPKQGRLPGVKGQREGFGELLSLMVMTKGKEQDSTGVTFPCCSVRRGSPIPSPSSAPSASTSARAGRDRRAVRVKKECPPPWPRVGTSLSVKRGKVPSCGSLPEPGSALGPLLPQPWGTLQRRAGGGSVACDPELGWRSGQFLVPCPQVHL